MPCDIKKTVLYDEHIRRHALMAEFAGWGMPIHYGSIVDEAKFARVSCSVFDICHMGEFIISEDPSLLSFSKAITHPVLKMKESTCAYGFLLNENGTVIDDLIIYRIALNRWMAVVNAANINRDAEAIQNRLLSAASFDDVSDKTAKIDVQGPKALDVMKHFAGDSVKSLRYFCFSVFNILGEECIVSRTGYTGELGFEVYLSNQTGVRFWNELCAHPLVKPAGLGARDILRLEAGLPLYGDELTEETTPLEAGMERFIDFQKDFYGKDALMQQKESGIKKILVAIETDGRRTPRHENRISVDGADSGYVTSGVFSPHLGHCIGFGYVNSDIAQKGRSINITGEHGGFDAYISEAPFVKNTSIRYRED
jgi:aminomethyltransferase